MAASSSNYLTDLKYKIYFTSIRDLENRRIGSVNFYVYRDDLIHSNPNGISTKILIDNIPFDQILTRDLFSHIYINNIQLYNDLFIGLVNIDENDPYHFLQQNFDKVRYTVKNNLIKTFFTAVTISFITLFITDMESSSMRATDVIDRLIDIQNRIYKEIEFRDVQTYEFLIEQRPIDFGHFKYRSKLRLEIDNFNFWINKIQDMISSRRRDFVLINPNSGNEEIIEFFKSFKLSLLLIQNNIKSSIHNPLSTDYIVGFV